MDCARFQVAVHDLYRGTLDPAAQAALERHARACAACARLRAACEELTCRALVDELIELQDGTLPRARAELLARHLAVCPDCRAYRASYEATLALTAEAFARAAEQPVELPEGLVQSILARRRAARGE